MSKPVLDTNSILRALEDGLPTHASLYDTLVHNSVNMWLSRATHGSVYPQYAGLQFSKWTASSPINPVHDTNLMRILSDLFAVISDADEFDEYFLRPTSYASISMWSMLCGASDYIKGGFPLGAVYPDGYGGLRIEWKNTDRIVRFIVPPSPDESSYLYHYSETGEDTVFSVTKASLGEKLNWFANLPSKTSQTDEIAWPVLEYLVPSLPATHHRSNQYATTQGLGRPSNRHDPWRIKKPMSTQVRASHLQKPSLSIVKR